MLKLCPIFIENFSKIRATLSQKEIKWQWWFVIIYKESYPYLKESNLQLPTLSYFSHNRLLKMNKFDNYNVEKGVGNHWKHSLALRVWTIEWSAIWQNPSKCMCMWLSVNPIPLIFDFCKNKGLTKLFTRALFITVNRWKQPSIKRKCLINDHTAKQ